MSLSTWPKRIQYTPCYRYGNRSSFTQMTKPLCIENHIIPWSFALTGYHVCLDSRIVGMGCSQLLAALWLITFGSNIDCKIQNKLNILSFCNLMWNIGFLASSILVTDPTEFAKIHTLFFFLFQTSLLRKCAVLNLSVSSYGSSYMCREAPVNIRRHARTHSFSDSYLRVFRWFSSTFKTSDGQLHDSSGTYALPRIKTGLRIKS